MHLTQISEEISNKVEDSTQHSRDTLQLCRNIAYTYNLLANSYIKKQMPAQTGCWEWLKGYVGVRLRIITSMMDSQKTCMYARVSIILPTGSSYVITLRWLGHWTAPSLPKFSIRPQNVVRSDSPIIQACQTRDIIWLQDILSRKEGQPNDRTPDGLTVFRVSFGAACNYHRAYSSYL